MGGSSKLILKKEGQWYQLDLQTARIERKKDLGEVWRLSLREKWDWPIGQEWS